MYNRLNEILPKDTANAYVVYRCGYFGRTARWKPDKLERPVVVDKDRGKIPQGRASRCCQVTVLTGLPVSIARREAENRT